MWNEALEKLINYLHKNQKKIISLSDFRELITSSFGEQLNEGRIYKLTHQLKNRGYLISLKKDILYINIPDKMPSENELEEMFYRKLLKQHCQYSCQQYRYIGGLTALEINLYWTGISIPEEIIVYNKHKQSIETVLLDKKVNFKTYEAKTQNLYIPFSKQTHTIKIKNCLVRYANLELSILECFYNIHPSNAGYLEGVITKALKKYQKTLKLTSFKHILKQGKHNSSANRLYKFTKNNQPDFAEELKKLVKKYGYIL